MIPTYIHYLGMSIALIYFISAFFANRIKQRALENASKDEQFIIFEARPDAEESGIGLTIIYFLMAIFFAYLINTFNSFISDPFGIIITVVAAVLMGWGDRFSDDYQERKLQEERAKIASTYLTQTYLKAERTARWLSMTPLVVFFIYLVIAV